MTDNLLPQSDGRIPFKGKGTRGTLGSETLETWVHSLALPFERVDQAATRIKQLEARRTALGKEAELLRNGFRDQFPRGVAPAYLCKDTDKTLTPLRWRISSSWSKAHARKRFEFGSDLGEEIISTLPHQAAITFLNTEIRRLHLNQAITTTMYELERLRGFVRGYRTWRNMRSRLLREEP